MDYYLLAVSPFPGRVMPMMRIGRYLAAVVPDRTAVPGGCDGDERRLKRQAAEGGELT